MAYSTKQIAANLRRNKPFRDDRRELGMRRCPWTLRWIKRVPGKLDMYAYCDTGTRCLRHHAHAAGFSPLTTAPEPTRWPRTSRRPRDQA
jgi:hypothetical protein